MLDSEVRKMLEVKTCSCGCRGEVKKKSNCPVPAGKGLTLADVPVGSSGTIARILPKMRGRKKFADVGMIAGTELRMEAHAPFGGLLRVKVMETSMVLHRDDAAQIVMKEECK